MKVFLPLILLFVFALTYFGQSVESPNGNLKLVFKLKDDGTPVYSLTRLCCINQQSSHFCFSLDFNFVTFRHSQVCHPI